jgi:hypothetical protein
MISLSIQDFCNEYDYSLAAVYKAVEQKDLSYEYGLYFNGYTKKNEKRIEIILDEHTQFWIDTHEVVNENSNFRWIEDYLLNDKIRKPSKIEINEISYSDIDFDYFLEI